MKKNQDNNNPSQGWCNSPRFHYADDSWSRYWTG